jgi:hypothetical protein
MVGYIVYNNTSSRDICDMYYGYPEKVLCTQYPSTRHSTHFYFPHNWEIHIKELLLSNGRVLGGKRGKRGTRLAKIPHPVMCSFLFSNFPHQPLS